MTMSSDDRTNAALTSIGSQLEGTAAGTLGLLLALCLAGLAGRLTFDAVAAALGFVVGGGLIISRAIVREALERVGWGGPLGVGQLANRASSAARSRTLSEGEEAAMLQTILEASSRLAEARRELTRTPDEAAMMGSNALRPPRGLGPSVRRRHTPGCPGNVG
jgi:hypothetical protein